MFEKRKVIVTLTTIPSRLNNTICTLKSLLNQTVIADEIVLSLPVESIREKSDKDPYIMNDKLKTFIKENNITVYRCSKDYGPATKIIGILERQFSKNIIRDNEPLIITVDDDKSYNEKTIEHLVKGWERNKNAVICRKGSIIFYTKKNNKNYLYEQVVKGNELNTDKEIKSLFGTGGVLYKASYFDRDIFNFKKKYPNFPEKDFFTVDDIFLSGYLALRNIKIIVPQFEKNSYDEFLKNQVLMKKIHKNYLYHLDKDSVNRKILPLANINGSKEGNRNNTNCVKYFSKYLLKIISKEEYDILVKND